jgi:hypothetical protein
MKHEPIYPEMVIKLSILHYEFVSCLSPYCVGLEVLRAVIMRSSVLWDMTLCILLKFGQCFRGTCRFHPWG